MKKTEAGFVSPYMEAWHWIIDGVPVAPPAIKVTSSSPVPARFSPCWWKSCRAAAACCVSTRCGGID